jgi:hypothetical protein
MAAISVGLAGLLIALGLVTMIVAGIRSLTLGKQDFKKIGMMAVPFVIFGITFAVSGKYATAGVATAGIMMAFMVLTIVFTGLRGTFKF